MEGFTGGTERKSISGREKRRGVLKDEVIGEEIEEGLFPENIARGRVVYDDTHVTPHEPLLNRRFL